jgi:RNA polymerase sigma-70 factor (ECF subfamily)
VADVSLAARRAYLAVGRAVPKKSAHSSPSGVQNSIGTVDFLTRATGVVALCVWSVVAMSEFDQRVGSLLAAGDTKAAVTLVLRELGPGILGFLRGMLPESDADEVFADLSERLLKGLGGFEGRSSVRTWTYVLARRQIGRFRRGMRRHVDGRVPISEFQDVIADVRTRTPPTFASDKHRRLAALRDALPEEDRELLILRIDRNLGFDSIALAFSDTPETMTDMERKRESARLRKRFELIKKRLAAQIRDAVTDVGDSRSDSKQRPGRR